MPPTDLVVVLPGIMGSTLRRNGHLVWAPSAGSALRAITTFTRSLKHLQLPDGIGDDRPEDGVDPVSLMDDRLRLEVARAVYGYPTLNKYAIDPAKSIRISVQGGNVELYGVVDSKSDKDVAYLRANQVPGVFSVKNYLQVASQGTEGK